ncbi:hypothetical protein LUZ60_014912 [Juncus effusus]|nr:hypothetical protein LUZ60_014912 [Juncus effusus]
METNRALQSMAPFFLLLLPLLLFSTSFCTAEESDEAYVTLLYGDQFVLGARVLGKSLRDTGTTRDLVALVSDGVSPYAQDLLMADGWKVEKISLLTNPNPKSSRPKRFWGVYTKLKIFDLTMYKKVVYLDADTIVVKNIDDLFKCGKFCANLKHSERLNSGVMVVEPSHQLFQDMLSKVNTLSSYTGGDQGFLNSYYSDFPNAHLFDPNKNELKPEPEMQRLSTLYNADVGLYMLANKWMVEEKELRIIHYTLGPLKPWDWYTAWLIKPVQVWQDIRYKVEASLPGTAGGKNPKDQFTVAILFLLPICLLALYYYRNYIPINRDMFICVFFRRVYNKYRSANINILPAYSSVSSSSSDNTIQLFTNGWSTKMPAHFGLISILSCFTSLLISLLLAFCSIPLQITPWTGLFLLFELTFVGFFFLFTGCLQLAYYWGSAVGGARTGEDRDSSAKGQQQYMVNSDAKTVCYWIKMAALAILAPLLPSLLGISSLFAKVGLMIGGGFVLGLVMQYAALHLAVGAFIKGEKNRDLGKC